MLRDLGIAIGGGLIATLLIQIGTAVWHLAI
ncbi:hypothetical protein EHYA_06967 [Embleya hyalina]|uniref:Uncharacterized protein n=1 Tax=Embleya hyalina TaxID=516124 RepID=A0A401YXC4_9ACTN|nr:hypothetical protein EHYA_06967 [Embleya hyalina]